MSNIRQMDERAQRLQKRLEWPMVIAALLVIPLLVIEESDFGEPFDTIGLILNWGTWLAFVGEAIVMVWVSPRPWQWIKRRPLDLIVIVLSPPFLPGSLAAARLVRLLRVVRLLRIFSMRRLLSLEGIRYAAFLAVFVVLVGGMAYAAAEREQSLTNWDGIWWALTTVTTVGYGDSIPATDLGRGIAIAVMATGIGFVALLTAYVADRFISQDVEEPLQKREEEVLGELRLVNARLAALERKIGG